MDLDQSGVLTVGSLVPKEGRHTLPHNTLLVISKKKCFSNALRHTLVVLEMH